VLQLPALDQAVIDDLKERLSFFLTARTGYGAPEYLDAGGSAAVFKVPFEDGYRAFKAFDPKFLSGPSGPAERRRLEVQKRLIAHDCPFLVQMFEIVEESGTAFTEMEFIEWPQLRKSLSDVPDEQIQTLINQLVAAVKYLEARDIVHRDIKPENIHVSPDFKHLKLLDLGVARAFEVGGGEEGALTDTGNTRPFVATAQYSSPEYLFRLDAPTGRLWKGLNFYQVGAVLHDLIAKCPLFSEEVGMNNRWLVARAVLTKAPSFVDANPTRLLPLKALALRCLTKDLETRLAIVDWSDFERDAKYDPLSKLRGRLIKSGPNASEQANESLLARLEFDRNDFASRFVEALRAELLDVVEGRRALTVKPPAAGEGCVYEFELALSPDVSAFCFVVFLWSDPVNIRTTTVRYSAHLSHRVREGEKVAHEEYFVCTATVGESAAEAERSTSEKLALAFIAGMDAYEGCADQEPLHGMDLAKSNEK
jgi:eukaryotic-like serine/threonine-protein kinase